MGAIADADARPGTTATERRIVAGALACIARQGLAGTTVEDLAREAGVSRATTYRLFPGGRDTIVDAVVGQEVRRFFADLAVELDRHDDLEDLVVAGMARALRFLTGHAALHAVLEREPVLLAPAVASHRLGVALDAASAFTAPYLRPHLADGPDLDRRALELAELVVRLVLSFAAQPSPHIDPADDASVARWVRAHVLPALRAPSPEPSPTQEQP